MKAISKTIDDLAKKRYYDSMRRDMLESLATFENYLTDSETYIKSIDGAPIPQAMHEEILVMDEVIGLTDFEFLGDVARGERVKRRIALLLALPYAQRLPRPD
jgi:hypothetical protein